MKRKIIKFALVGLVNTALQYVIFQSLTIVFKVTSHDSLNVFLIGIFANSIALVNSFILNKKYTFKDKRRSNIHQFSKFLIVNVITILISSGVVSLTSVLLPQKVLIYKYAVENIRFTNLFGVAVAMFFNFIAYHYIVFKETEGENEQK